MTRRKCPGLDEYLQTYSISLLPLLLETLSEVHKTGILPTNMREALMIMLPKPDRDPTDMGSYRPLYMLNGDVKLLAGLELEPRSSEYTSFIRSHITIKA
ncbi:hypothetical protein NDU88_005437 [Pleurodeles waltl]|uniref:Uncharacterized protein n=1 Tax=Pleurodeles waltl TaxID=8319 RepID=A0AAV7M9A8_PLEWA|nr:hypothetical protein NDU88_005437 [Pleurodeles waltl]